METIFLLLTWGVTMSLGGWNDTVEWKRQRRNVKQENNSIPLLDNWNHVFTQHCVVHLEGLCYFLAKTNLVDWLKKDLNCTFQEVNSLPAERQWHCYWLIGRIIEFYWSTVIYVTEYLKYIIRVFTNIMDFLHFWATIFLVILTLQ
jgi:hypothetical protein